MGKRQREKKTSLKLSVRRPYSLFPFVIGKLFSPLSTLRSQSRQNCEGFFSSPLSSHSFFISRSCCARKCFCLKGRIFAPLWKVGPLSVVGKFCSPFESVVQTPQLRSIYSPTLQLKQNFRSPRKAVMDFSNPTTAFIWCLLSGKVEMRKLFLPQTRHPSAYLPKRLMGTAGETRFLFRVFLASSGVKEEEEEAN